MKKSFAGLALLASLARAEPLPSDPLERQCWLAHTSQRTAVDLREPVSVHFSNLKTGYRVRSPFWVEFGIRGMGVIPAGNVNDKAGHHHILIDTPLPRDHTAPIPFSDTHKHFGKGQTGTELNLPPGRHTLRLLFADHAQAEAIRHGKRILPSELTGGEPPVDVPLLLVDDAGAVAVGRSDGARVATVVGFRA